MIFTRELMILKPELTRNLLDLVVESDIKKVMVEGRQEPTGKFKNWCKKRGLIWENENS